ncbi:MAG: hypothetical protein GY782_08370 [Gammaproteobacteria bacterium]|nr:hypothetical protein [Gammaproteobacteria bacterium]
MKQRNQSRAQKKLRGTHKSRVHDEPGVKYEIPRCPTGLDNDVKKLWKEKAPPLIKVRVLSKFNADSFVQYLKEKVLLNSLTNTVMKNTDALFSNKLTIDGVGTETKESTLSQLIRYYSRLVHDKEKVWFGNPKAEKGNIYYTDDEGVGDDLLS